MTYVTSGPTQWHPAFEAEHLLSKKPMQVDQLIIKLDEHEVIHKNIGQLFKKYNIIEYKSPDDYLSINDFYKVYGYCCFYQSDTEHVLEIPPQELTITFVTNHYPREMLKHLETFRKMKIIKKEPGIYYLEGDPFKMQLLLISELDPIQNCWLRSLRKDITDHDEIENLINLYEQNKDSKLYQSIMEVITRANWQSIKEAKPIMCEALKELMAEEFEEERRKTTEKVTQEVTQNLNFRYIQALYNKIGDMNQVANLLELPLETVRQCLS